MKDERLELLIDANSYKIISKICVMGMGIFIVGTFILFLNGLFLSSVASGIFAIVMMCSEIVWWGRCEESYRLFKNFKNEKRGVRR